METKLYILSKGKKKRQPNHLKSLVCGGCGGFRTAVNEIANRPPERTGREFATPGQRIRISDIYKILKSVNFCLEHEYLLLPLKYQESFNTIHENQLHKYSHLLPCICTARF
jgi:hypothetical protein